MAVSYPVDRTYTKEHEWAQIEGDLVRIGVTHYAQDSLGDVVFVQLPSIGGTIRAGKPFGSVESTKAVSDLFAPISGTIVEINAELSNDTILVNTDPHGAAWMIKVKPSDPSELKSLLSAADYEQFLKDSGH